MAPDSQWPSEDEDFDAVTDNANKTKTAEMPERKAVSIKTDDDDEHDSPNDAQDESAPADGDEHDSSGDDHEESNESDESADEPAETEKADTDKPDAEEGHNDHDDADEHDHPASKPAPVIVSSQAGTSSELSSAHRDLEKGTVSPAVEAAAAQLAEEEDASMSDINLPDGPKQKSSPGRLLLEIILVMALAGVGYWAWSLSSSNKDLTASNGDLKSQVTQLNAHPEVIIQRQTNELIQKVGALMQLPKNETPTIANVSDAAAAKKQSAFFANAQNGDRVLMYVKAGQAILYRPSTNKIILVAPLTFSGTPTAAATTPGTTAATATKAKR